jgi:DNA invertase Pin-like site-specific DNA recombinase
LTMTISRENPGITNPKKGYPEEFRQRVCKAFYEEWPRKTYEQIADEFGIGHSTLYKWVRPDHRKVIRDQYHHNINRIREMRWEGCTYSYIARETGVPRATVWDYINRPWMYANR